MEGRDRDRGATHVTPGRASGPGSSDEEAAWTLPPAPDQPDASPAQAAEEVAEALVLQRLRRRQATSSTTSRAARGAATTGASRITQQGLQFAGTIVLARILTPDDYGLSAVAFSVSAFANLIGNLGLSASIVRAEVVDEKLLSTVFWMDVLVRLALTVGLVAAAYPLAQAFGKPGLTGLLAVASLNFLLNYATVSLGILERLLLFGVIARAEVAGAFSSLATTLALGIGGAGPYALVIGPVVSTVVINAVVLWTARWRPRSGIDRGRAAEVWRYGRGLFVFYFVNYWARNADNLLLGRYASQQNLGYYSRAYNLMLLPVGQITTVVNRVLFPALRELRDRGGPMGSAWLRATRLALTLTLPVAIGIATTAPDFVRVLYGARWDGMATLLAILSLSAPAQILGATIVSVYQVTGETGLLARRGIYITVTTLACIVAGLAIDGTRGVCIGFLVSCWVTVPFTMMAGLRMLDTRFSAVVEVLRGCVVAMTAMAAAVVAIRLLVSGPSAARLALEIVAGGAVYVGALALLDRAMAADLARRVAGRLPGSRS